MLLRGCFEIVLVPITAYPTASVYSFQACRPPTRMLVDSQFCNKLPLPRQRLRSIDVARLYSSLNQLLNLVAKIVLQHNLPKAD